MTVLPLRRGLHAAIRPLHCVQRGTATSRLADLAQPEQDVTSSDVTRLALERSLKVDRIFLLAFVRLEVDDHVTGAPSGIRRMLAAQNPVVQCSVHPAEEPFGTAVLRHALGYTLRSADPVAPNAMGPAHLSELLALPPTRA